MSQYNIPEFRKDLRKAFDLAEAGEVVEIVRFDRVYQLVVTPFEPDSSIATEGTPPPLAYNPDTMTVVGKPVKEVLVTKKNNSVADATKLAAKAVEQKKQATEGLKFCKNGHLLATNGKCLQKGCKYGR